MMITAVFGLLLAVWGCSSNERTSLSSEASISSLEHNAKEAESAEEAMKDGTGSHDKDDHADTHGHKTAKAEKKDKKDRKAEKHGDSKHAAKTTKKTSHEVAARDEHETHGDKNETAHATTKKRSPASQKEMVYIVQVGAFRVKDNAEKLQARLKGEGFPVLLRDMNHSKNGLMHLVRFEPTPTRAEADKWVAQIKEKAGFDAVVLAQPADE
jgi:cell division septation protein DedD